MVIRGSLIIGGGVVIVPVTSFLCNPNGFSSVSVTPCKTNEVYPRTLPYRNSRKVGTDIAGYNNNVWYFVTLTSCL